MAIRIFCNQVEKEFRLNSLEGTECPGCHSEIDSNHKILKNSALIGFSLTYEKTGEQIEFISADDFVLGRENSGKHLFEKVLSEGNHVISRRHCRIRREGDQFVVTDEKSMNGTFVGLDKQDCSKQSVVLEDNGILYLGKELFTFRLIHAEEKKSDSASPKDDTSLPLKYKCVRCGSVYDSYSEVCPNPVCQEFNGLRTF